MKKNENVFLDIIIYRLYFKSHLSKNTNGYVFFVLLIIVTELAIACLEDSDNEDDDDEDAKDDSNVSHGDRDGRNRHHAQIERHEKKEKCAVVLDSSGNNEVRAAVTTHGDFHDGSSFPNPT
jgi:hypothetical protein